MNGKTISAAMDAHRRAVRETSAVARKASSQHCGQKQTVLNVWKWLKTNDQTPCSQATAARLVTESTHEFRFSENQTNYDVIRKRTSELVADGVLIDLGAYKDQDGVERQWYQIAQEA